LLLTEILANTEVLTAPVPKIEIADVFHDSREVRRGSLFVALRGFETDGHKYIKEAVKNGAAAVVCEEAPANVGVPCILVKDSREALDRIASAFFNHPSRDMKVIGVTGTNGKTTTTHLIRSILSANGVKVGLIGTIHNMIGDEVLETERTTPDSLSLQRLLAKMRDAGCRFVVMEVSSHALVLNRVDSVAFECGVFTNLTQDHLDFHRTMENYLEAKLLLFKKARISVVNLDDKYAERIIDSAFGNVLTYSAAKNEADIVAKEIKLNPASVEFVLVSTGEIHRVMLPIPGLFSVYNALAAITACRSLGLGFAEMIEPLKKQAGVTGRAEVVPAGEGYTVIIDYAHSPDSLENIIRTAKGFAQGRVVTLFGCGGDRDRKKRPLMGEIATRMSDFTIITSDNPRTEEPGAIIAEILTGIYENAPHAVIENRKEAIFYALDNARPNDVIILAGKGHETYQEINHVKHHFDEREVIASYFAEKRRAAGGEKHATA